MISLLNSANSGIGQLGLLKPTAQFGLLPQELFDEIFSYLGKNDMQAAACVNRSLRGRIQEVANYNELASIKKFILVLIQKLNAEIFAVQRGLLVGISQNITFQEFKILRLLKEYILQVKVQLIEVIKTLDEETSNDLKPHLQFPHFMENIFELAKFERRIDVANLLPNVFLRAHSLENISLSLAYAGNIDRAIIVAQSIPREFNGESSLVDISLSLIRAGNIDGAIIVAQSIASEFVRRRSLGNISKALAHAGNIDRAIIVAQSILDEIVGNRALGDISRALIQAGNIDGAIHVAQSIPDEHQRRDALNISRDLTQIDNLEREISVGRSIPDEIVRNRVLSDISRACTRAGNIFGAIIAAQSIDSKFHKNDVLEGISFALAKARKIDRAIDVSMLISEDRRGFALSGISGTLAGARNFDRAIDVAKSISNEYDRERALEYVCSCQSPLLHFLSLCIPHRTSRITNFSGFVVGFAITLILARMLLPREPTA